MRWSGPALQLCMLVNFSIEAFLASRRPQRLRHPGTPFHTHVTPGPSIQNNVRGTPLGAAVNNVDAIDLLNERSIKVGNLLLFFALATHACPNRFSSRWPTGCFGRPS